MATRTGGSAARAAVAVVAALGLALGGTATLAADDQGTRLSVEPGKGPAGSEADVHGAGFAEGRDVEIRWGSTDELLATASGPQFSATVTIPDGAAEGDQTIGARSQPGAEPEAQAQRAITAFTVTGAETSRAEDGDAKDGADDDADDDDTDDAGSGDDADDDAADDDTDEGDADAGDGEESARDPDADERDDEGADADESDEEASDDDEGADSEQRDERSPDADGSPSRETATAGSPSGGGTDEGGSSSSSEPERQEGSGGPSEAAATYRASSGGPPTTVAQTSEGLDPTATEQPPEFDLARRLDSDAFEIQEPIAADPEASDQATRPGTSGRDGRTGAADDLELPSQRLATAGDPAPPQPVAADPAAPAPAAAVGSPVGALTSQGLSLLLLVAIAAAVTWHRRRLLASPRAARHG